MTSHVERMQTEFQELDEKTEKLKTFIKSNPLFKELEQAEQILLQLQLQAMCTYWAVLKQRLELVTN